MPNCEHRYAEAVYDAEDIIFNERTKENEVLTDDKGKRVPPKKIVCRDCNQTLPSDFPALGCGGAV